MENNQDVLVLQREQYNLIWRYSWLSLCTSMYAVYNKYYVLACLPGGIFVTSILYWQKPDYSIRRYIDIIYSTSAISYQMYYAYDTKNAIPYYTFMSLGITSFMIGVYFHKKNNWYSTYFHIGLHVLGNIANVFLFSSI